MSDVPAVKLPSRGRSIFYVLVIFVAGAIFGSALTLGIGRQVVERSRTTASWNAEGVRRLDRHLGLTPEQRARVQPIVLDMLMRLRETRVTARREAMDILQDTRTKLRAELTPEQLERFEKLAARWRGNAGRFMGGAQPGSRLRDADDDAPDPKP